MTTHTVLVHDNSHSPSTEILHRGTLSNAFLDGPYSTVQGLMDWWEVDLGFIGFTELFFFFIQIDLCTVLFSVSSPMSPMLSPCSPRVHSWTSDPEQRNQRCALRALPRPTSD